MNLCVPTKNADLLIKIVFNGFDFYNGHPSGFLYLKI